MEFEDQEYWRALACSNQWVHTKPRRHGQGMLPLTQVDPSPDDPGEGTTGISMVCVWLINYPSYPLLIPSCPQVQVPKERYSLRPALLSTQSPQGVGAPPLLELLWNIHRCLSKLNYFTIKNLWQGATLMVGLPLGKLEGFTHHLLLSAIKLLSQCSIKKVVMVCLLTTKTLVFHKENT